MSLAPVIWVEGLIGAGKTTLAKTLAQELSLQPYLEPVDTNPYLRLFYEDPKRWAFPMQVHLLAHRYVMQQRAAWASVMRQGAVLDRGLPGDRVFCELHRQAGNMSELEWLTYDQFYEIMVGTLRVPSLILYLDVTPEVALERIRKRDRRVEGGIPLWYLNSLRYGYERLLQQVESGRHAWAQGMKVLRVEWNDENLPTQPILEQIRQRIRVGGPSSTA